MPVPWKIAEKHNRNCDRPRIGSCTFYKRASFAGAGEATHGFHTWEYEPQAEEDHEERRREQRSELVSRITRAIR